MVQFYSPSALPLEDTGAHLNVRLTLRPTIPHPDLTYLTDSAHGPESGVRLELGRDGGRPVDILDIDGTVSPKHAEILEQASWQHMPEEHPLRADQFGNYQDRTPPSIAIHYTDAAAADLPSAAPV